MAVGFSGMLFMFGLQPFDDNVHICGSPLYHTAVLVFAGGAIHAGHTVVLMDKWAPDDMLRLIDTHRVTNTHMVPTQFVRLLALPDDVKAKYDVSSLRHMVHAAAPCPPEVKRQMLEWWGPVIDEYYAASEGGGTIVFAERVARAARHRRQGVGDLGDRDPRRRRQRAPAGEIGTVYMHMVTGNFEYFKDKEKTDRSRHGKFFTVGDVGYLDPEGWLFLSDRKTDMIISGGANIYPAEIESVLIMHPKVADVAVFGIPHDDWGEAVKAVVEPIEFGDGRTRARGRDPRLVGRQAGEVQDAALDRLRRGAAARPEREALQAQAPRPVLGRPRARDLIAAP